MRRNNCASALHTKDAKDDVYNIAKNTTNAHNVAERIFSGPSFDEEIIKSTLTKEMRGLK